MRRFLVFSRARLGLVGLGWGSRGRLRRVFRVVPPAVRRRMLCSPSLWSLCRRSLCACTACCWWWVTLFSAGKGGFAYAKNFVLGKSFWVCLGCVLLESVVLAVWFWLLLEVFWFSCGCFWWVRHSFSVCVGVAVLGSVCFLVCFRLWVLRNPCCRGCRFYVGEVVGACWRGSIVHFFASCADVQFFSIGPSINRKLHGFWQPNLSIVSALSSFTLDGGYRYMPTRV